MRVTKHEHAFLQLELNGAQLLMDPGSYTTELPETKNVVAITLSHVHDDHSYLPHIQKLLSKYPKARVFGPSEVARKLSGVEVIRCHHGDRHEVSGFIIDFFGYHHQEIHRSIPLAENLGVKVNNLYYPGDSYTIPETQVDVLACPSSAPWLRISDVIDFLTATKPRVCFPTHNSLLSEAGHALQNSRIQEFTERFGGRFSYLLPGDSIEI